MPMDLRRLHNATVLASERNFTKAAGKLCMTQSALSRSITKLESELGLQLFDRNPGDVTLTAVGKTFIERAHTLLQHAQDVRCDMALVRDGLSGNLVFGMAPYLATAFLSAVVGNVLHEQQGVKVRVEVASREQLLNLLNAEEIEFFLASSSQLALGAQYLIKPLFKMGLSLFVRRDHPLASREISDASELLRYPFIGAVVAPSHLLNLKFAMGLPSNSNFQLTVACDDFPVLKSLALTSDAILIAPHMALGDEYTNGSIQSLECVGPLKILTNASIEVCIVKFSNRVLSPAAESIVELLRTLAGQVR